MLFWWHRSNPIQCYGIDHGRLTVLCQATSWYEYVRGRGGILGARGSWQIVFWWHRCDPMQGYGRVTLLYRDTPYYKYVIGRGGMPGSIFYGFDHGRLSVHTKICDRKGRYTRIQRQDFAKFTQFRSIPQSQPDPITQIMIYEVTSNDFLIHHISNFILRWGLYSFLIRWLRTSLLSLKPATCTTHVWGAISNHPLTHFTE